MIYQVKIKSYKKIKPILTIKCGEQYLDGFKKDLLDTNTNYLDCENVIINKKDIRCIIIKKLSDN